MTRTFVRFSTTKDGTVADLDFGWCETAFAPEEGFEEYISVDCRRSSPDEVKTLLEIINKSCVAIYDEWTGYIRIMIDRRK